MCLSHTSLSNVLFLFKTFMLIGHVMFKIKRSCREKAWKVGYIFKACLSAEIPPDSSSSQSQAGILNLCLYFCGFDQQFLSLNEYENSMDAYGLHNSGCGRNLRSNALYQTNKKQISKTTTTKTTPTPQNLFLKPGIVATPLIPEFGKQRQVDL